MAYSFYKQNYASRIGLLLVTLLCFSPPLTARSKDDLVVMKNGDRFTGELKKLEHGVLYFKASYMVESVQLDWNQVEKLESRDQFFVTLQSGKRYTTGIEKSGGREGSSFVLSVTSGNSIQVPALEVVEMRQSENTFWSQLNGSIDYGLSYSSGNNALNSSLGASAEYRRTKDLFYVATNSQFSTQSTGATTNRFTFDGQYFRLITERWFYGGLLDLLKSDQQDLSLRTTVGGAIGRTIVRTERTRFSLFGGGVLSREKYFQKAQSEPTKSNGEALIGADFYTFRFKVLDLRSRAMVYPSLSDPGRVRLSSDTNLHIELIKDFYWDFHLYENFDSRPPVSAPRNDLGITTGIGWKF